MLEIRHDLTYIISIELIYTHKLFLNHFDHFDFDLVIIFNHYSPQVGNEIH